MKKLISLITVLAIVLACAASFADPASATKVDPFENRNIKIQPAGDNPWPVDENGHFVTSPTTGRTMAELEDLFEDGMSGMVVTDKYYPIMVQHCNYEGGVLDGAPFYGSYADIYYEMPKYIDGTTRLTMLFNDLLPKYAGASRSLRVGHLYIRQEWNAPYFFQGVQETNAEGSKLITNVKQVAATLGIPGGVENWNGLKSADRWLFSGTNDGKTFLNYQYYIKFGKLPSGSANVIWNLPGLLENELGLDRSFADHNHTLKFGEMSVEGDAADTVYVYFHDAARPAVSVEDGKYYFNCMYQYDPDENVYYRYVISDPNDPEKGAVLFDEMLLTNETIKTRVNAGHEIKSGTLSHGEPITFANIIVQAVNMEWAGGSPERPVPELLGTGNADYFIGGKHYAGVWNRENYDDRTVFYGEDGQEISLQPGRTIIVIMDYNTSVHRTLRYEAQN